MIADAARTLELDAWLDRADVRITRALRDAGWVKASELFQTLELEPAQFAHYESTLARLVRSGHVQRRSERFVGTDYALVREMTVPKPGESLPPDRSGIAEGEQIGAWFWWRGSWRPM